MGNESSAQRPKVGYHVLKVVEDSPGARAGLSPYFDFIVAANGQVLDKEDARLVDVLRNNLEHEVELSVYNLKQEKVRRATLVPSLQWGGHGIVGVSTRFCSVTAAYDNVWHILDIAPNSPAADAGLESYLDYVVGTPDLAFNDSEDFFRLIQSNIGVTVQLYIYNLRDDDVRLVSLKPRKDWGGVGYLGCGVGFGLLHRIAHDRKAALAQRGITLDDAERGMMRPNTPPPPSDASTASPLTHDITPATMVAAGSEALFIVGSPETQYIAASEPPAAAVVAHTATVADDQTFQEPVASPLATIALQSQPALSPSASRRVSPFAAPPPVSTSYYQHLPMGSSLASSSSSSSFSSTFVMSPPSSSTSACLTGATPTPTSTTTTTMPATGTRLFNPTIFSSPLRPPASSGSNSTSPYGSGGSSFVGGAGITLPYSSGSASPYGSGVSSFVGKGGSSTHLGFGSGGSSFVGGAGITLPYSSGSGSLVSSTAPAIPPSPVGRGGGPTFPYTFSTPTQPLYSPAIGTSTATSAYPQHTAGRPSPYLLASSSPYIHSHLSGPAASGLDHSQPQIYQPPPYQREDNPHLGHHDSQHLHQQTSDRRTG